MRQIAPPRTRPIAEKQSLPRWRAALDHPVTRTTIILLQLAAFAVAATGALIAANNLAGAQRMAAYTLISQEGVGTAVRWQAAKALMEGGDSLDRFPGGCEAENMLDRCAVLEHYILEPKAKTTFSRIRGTNIEFRNSALKNVVFDGGTLSGSGFIRTHVEIAMRNIDLSNVRFELMSGEERVDLYGRADIFVGNIFTPSPVSFVVIDESDATGAWFMAEDLGIFSIYGTDLSGAHFEGDAASGFVAEGNYYLVGRPPVFSAPTTLSQLVEWECFRKPLPGGGFEVMRSACRQIAINE